MRHTTSLQELKLDQPSALTIGAFDGVHRGHQALIGEMVAAAHSIGRAAVVLTFFPHPSVVLRGRRPSFYLSSPEEKAEYLAALGVDDMLTHPFDRSVSEIPASEFVERLVSGSLRRLRRLRSSLILFCIRLHSVLKERIAIDETGARESLRIG